MSKDITDKEWNKIYLPYNNNLDNFMIKYIMPEVLSFKIAQGHYRGCLDTDKFEVHFKNMLNIIDIKSSFNEVKEATINLLKIKYNLKVINEDPLTVERWE